MIPTSSLAYALVFLVGGISCIWSQENVCDHMGEIPKGVNITRHFLKDGTARCCYLLTCTKGTYGVPCDENRPETTKCKNCDEQTHYNPGPGRSDGQTHCKTKSKCYESLGLVVADNGSTYEDRTCRCNLEQGFFKSAPGFANDPPTCTRKICRAGTELHYNDGNCRECRAYTFKSEEGFHQCQPLTDCKILGLERDTSHHFNATHDTKCYNASAIEPIGPIIGPVEEEGEGKTHKVLIILGGLLAGVMCVTTVVVLVIYRYHRLGADSDSHGSAGERKTCLSESSISDQEDNVENNKRIIKRDHDLKVDIPCTFGEKVDLKGNHTPDSGIFTGYPPHLTPSLNGGILGHHPPPYFISNLPSTGLETDAEAFQGHPAESPSNDSDLHSTSGVSSCPSKEEKLSEEKCPHPGGGSIPPGTKGAPPVIHIHHHYRQVGNRNQMVVKPTATAAEEYLKQGQLSGDSNCDYENDSYEEEDNEYEDSEYESGPEYQRSTTV